MLRGPTPCDQRQPSPDLAKSYGTSCKAYPFSSGIRLPAKLQCIYGKEVLQPNVTLDITRDELTVHRERAFLVSVALPERPWISTDPLEELQGLATTAGAIVVGGMVQRRQNI